MVEGIMAEAYGVPTPLIQLATITTPEPMQLQISPFDPSNVTKIADAIRNAQDLGFNPTDDGRVVRIQIPALTTERRAAVAHGGRHVCFAAGRRQWRRPDHSVRR